MLEDALGGGRAASAMTTITVMPVSNRRKKRSPEAVLVSLLVVLALACGCIPTNRCRTPRLGTAGGVANLLSSPNPPAYRTTSDQYSVLPRGGRRALAGSVLILHV
jgi:hypothetical protein